MANERNPLRHRRILVVDDELAIRRALQTRFRDDGAEAETAEDVAAARAQFRKGEFDLIVLDHRLPDGTGLALMEELKRDGYPAEIVMMTAYSSTQDAVRAMKSGAADYVMKPFDLDEMVLVAERALSNRQLRGEVERLRARDRTDVTGILGSSKTTRDLRALVERIAESGARTILIRGESGTGKDLVARAIHEASPERDRPFLNITCTAIQETLLESELFGHEKGAFTDAKQAKMGLFEQADGGTIFLDEIGDMPASLQAKLLRFLEHKQFRRVGGLSDVRVDVRIVAATNKNLEKAIQDGSFRSDLYYRLNVIPVDIPPLRQRREDVRELVEYFTRRFAQELRKTIDGFDAAAQARLEACDWPGNVRELRNCVERAVLLSTGPTLTVADLPREVAGAAVEVAAADPATAPVDPAPAVPREAAPDGDGSAARAPRKGHRFTLPAEGLVVDEVLADLLDQALERCNGNKSQSAALLGIHRDQVRYWVKKYALERWIRRRVGGRLTRGSAEPSGED